MPGPIARYRRNQLDTAIDGPVGAMPRGSKNITPPDVSTSLKPSPPRSWGDTLGHLTGARRGKEKRK